MLLEQNTALRRDLEAARAELRAVRVRDLAASVLGDLASTPGREAEVETLRGERDAHGPCCAVKTRAPGLLPGARRG
jgi:hypothetical protein